MLSSRYLNLNVDFLDKQCMLDMLNCDTESPSNRRGGAAEPITAWSDNRLSIDPAYHVQLAEYFGFSGIRFNPDMRFDQSLKPGDYVVYPTGIGRFSLMVKGYDGKPDGYYPLIKDHDTWRVMGQPLGVLKDQFGDMPLNQNYQFNFGRDTITYFFNSKPHVQRFKNFYDKMAFAQQLFLASQCSLAPRLFEAYLSKIECKSMTDYDFSFCFSSPTFVPAISFQLGSNLTDRSFFSYHNDVHPTVSAMAYTDLLLFAKEIKLPIQLFGYFHAGQPNHLSDGEVAIFSRDNCFYMRINERPTPVEYKINSTNWTCITPLEEEKSIHLIIASHRLNCSPQQKMAAFVPSRHSPFVNLPSGIVRFFSCDDPQQDDFGVFPQINIGEPVALVEMNGASTPYYPEYPGQRGVFNNVEVTTLSRRDLYIGDDADVAYDRKKYPDFDPKQLKIEVRELHFDMQKKDQKTLHINIVGWPATTLLPPQILKMIKDQLRLLVSQHQCHSLFSHDVLGSGCGQVVHASMSLTKSCDFENFISCVNAVNRDSDHRVHTFAQLESLYEMTHLPDTKLKFSEQLIPKMPILPPVSVTPSKDDFGVTTINPPHEAAIVSTEKKGDVLVSSKEKPILGGGSYGVVKPADVMITNPDMADFIRGSGIPYTELTENGQPVLVVADGIVVKKQELHMLPEGVLKDHLFKVEGNKLIIDYPARLISQSMVARGKSADQDYALKCITATREQVDLVRDFDHPCLSKEFLASGLYDGQSHVMHKGRRYQLWAKGSGPDGDIVPVQTRKLFTLMERVPGYQLSHFLDHDDDRLKLKFLIQVLEGLAYMHELKIAHRDIKPDNIMIYDKGRGDYNAKIVDFGFARKFGDPDFKKYRGTPGFIAPEVCENGRTGENKVELGSEEDKIDAYAVAMMGFRMFFKEFMPREDGPYTYDQLRRVVDLKLNSVFRKTHRFEVDARAYFYRVLGDVLLGMADPNPKYRMSVAESLKSIIAKLSC